MNSKSSLLITLLLFWLVPATLAASSGIMRPQVDDGESDISGWWMSEKLDGVRGYWDGRQLWSKNGRQLQPPAEFLTGLPEFALEGELWAGRGTFENTASIVRKDRPHVGWLRLKFAIFDAPTLNGPFTKRIGRVQKWFAEHPSGYAFVISQRPVRDRAQVQQELRRIEALGGEGLIIRDPRALYTAGRSPKILKVKGFSDAEAVVVGHVPGRGANSGRLGSLLVEMKDGTCFKIGTGFSNTERENPPPIGVVITYKYYGFYQSGLPRFPSFLRVRYDQGL